MVIHKRADEHSHMPLWHLHIYCNGALTDGKQLYIMNRDSNGKSTLFGKDVHPYVEYVIND